MAKELVRENEDTKDILNEESKPKKMSTIQKWVMSMMFSGAAILGIGSLAQPVAADMSAFSLNLTWVGTMFAGLFQAGAAVAPGFQSFIEAWFGPLIEAVVLVAVVTVIGMVFIVGPAKLIQVVERMLEKIF